MVLEKTSTEVGEPVVLEAASLKGSDTQIQEQGTIDPGLQQVRDVLTSISMVSPNVQPGLPHPHEAHLIANRLALETEFAKRVLKDTVKPHERIVRKTLPIIIFVGDENPISISINIARGIPYCEAGDQKILFLKLKNSHIEEGLGKKKSDSYSAFIRSTDLMSKDNDNEFSIGRLLKTNIYCRYMNDGTLQITNLSEKNSIYVSHD